MKCEKYKKILFEAVCLSLVVKSSSRYYHCYKVEGLAWDAGIKGSVLETVKQSQFYNILYLEGTQKDQIRDGVGEA